MRLKGSVSVTQKHGNPISCRAAGAYREIGLAISIKVSSHHGQWSRGGGEVHVRLEGSISDAQQDRNVVAGAVADSQVFMSVAIEIGDGQTARTWARSIADRRGESAVAKTEQHANRAIAAVGDGQIKFAVSDEFIDSDCGGSSAGPCEIGLEQLKRSIAVAE